MSETDGLNPVELVLPVASGWAEGGYREYERSAFALVRAAMDGRLDITQTAAAMDGCTPEARNRIGYLLSLAGMPEPWPPEPSPPAALYRDDPLLRHTGEPDANNGDALAKRWNLVRGADLGRLRQFLQTGLN